MLPPRLLDLLTDLLGPNVETGTAAVAVVTVAVLARVYFGSVLFSPQYVTVWNIIRRVATPILQRVIYRFMPLDVEIENESVFDEYAATVEMDPKPLATTLDGVREVEIPLLAGYKTAPDDRKERATFVWYVGPRPLAWLPRWLRRYQVHVSVFQREGGDAYDLYAHYEANSYRLDMWADHLFKGPSFSAEQGVTRTRNALDEAEIEWIRDEPGEG